MATTDLRLDEPGTLPRPGPLGRIVRLAFGALCAYYLLGIVNVYDGLMDGQGHVRSVIWNGVLIGLFLISYVINIGFSKDWKKWPAVVSACLFLLLGAYGYFSQAAFETTALAGTIWVWEFYLFTHLGISFLLAALLATPGCEMRAIPDLYARLSGSSAKEHICPVGPLTAIDRWEASR